MSAASSLIGTAAGWRESVMKKLGKASGEQLWKGVKNKAGIAGNIADAFGSGWQAYKEFDSDDKDAAAAQIVSGIGAGAQAFGYALAIMAVPGAPIVLMLGAAVAAVGTI